MLLDALKSELGNESDPDDAAKGARAYKYDLWKRLFKATQSDFENESDAAKDVCAYEYYL